jgi:hypothetical protein
MTVGSLSYAVERKLMQEDAFIATTDFNSIGVTTGYPYLLFKNPTGNELRALVTHISWGLDSSSARSIVRLCKNPTITSDGTALTVENTYIKASPRATTMEVYKEPTVTANGNQLVVQLTPANTASRGLQRFFMIDPGNSLLVCVENSIANCNTFTEILWLEM